MPAELFAAFSKNWHYVWQLQNRQFDGVFFQDDCKVQLCELELSRHRWIPFVDPSGKRQTVRLGKIEAKHAAKDCTRVEELLAARLTGTPIDRDLANWPNDLEDARRKKLAAVNLCEDRESAILGAFITSYVDSRTDVKPATKEIWRQGERGLIEFFGANKPLRDVTPGDADRYKQQLIGKQLAPMTVRKRLQFATMIFRAALRR